MEGVGLDDGDGGVVGRSTDLRSSQNIIIRFSRRGGVCSAK